MGRFPLYRHGNALAAAGSPGRDVTSGAEDSEWCSEGQTKGGRRRSAASGGGTVVEGRGCLPGGCERRAQVSGSGGG